jgi:hypothetical protein
VKNDTFRSAFMRALRTPRTIKTLDFAAHRVGRARRAYRPQRRLCIQETDLRLIGVIDDDRVTPFFGIAADRASGLRSNRLNGRSFGRLVVMSFDEIDLIRARLDGLSISPGRVCWI